MNVPIPGLPGVLSRIRAWFDALPAFAPPLPLEVQVDPSHATGAHSDFWPVLVAERRAVSSPRSVLTEAPAIERVAPPVAVPEVRFGGREIVEDLAEEWRELCDAGPCDEPFCRPEWVSAYLRAFAPQARVVLVSARVRGRLQAVLPLIAEAGWFCGLPVNKLRAPANVHSVRFDLVRGAGEEGEAAVRVVWRALRNLPGWDMIELPCTFEGGAHELLLRAARRDSFPGELVRVWRSIFVPLPNGNGDARQWRPGRKPQFRSKLSRRRRQLEQKAPLALRHCELASPQSLRKFFALEASGWKGRRGSAIACQPQLEQFYTDIACAAARYGYLSLDRLESGGQVVSAHFGMCYRGRYFLPKAAYNEDYRRFGPGLLLVESILREHEARGIREFDFAGPWARDESQWGLQTRDQYFTYIFHRRLYGSFLHSIRFRLRRAVKKLLRRESFATLPAAPDIEAS